MSRTVLTGLSGANPLGFMGALGLLRVLAQAKGAVRLGFEDDASFRPFIEGIDGVDVSASVAADASRRACSTELWWLTYDKGEKRGTKKVADLKAPPEVFERYLRRCVDKWRAGEGEAASHAAAFGTSVARDGKGNAKPTAFHFTAANQQFLDTVEKIRGLVTPEWARQSLFEGAPRPGPNLRWDPAAERNWALRASDPVQEGTYVDAPLEWLAFRSLPLFPTVPVGNRVSTTCVVGRGEDMTMTWPLWGESISLDSARSALQVDWSDGPSHAGVFAVCASAIRRMGQGFGNFGPGAVMPLR